MGDDWRSSSFFSLFSSDRDWETRESLDRVRNRLEELANRIKEIKSERAQTRAHKALKEKEISNLKRKRYQQTGRKFALDAVNKIMSGNEEDAIEAVKECLDYKAYVRTEPHLKRTGAEMENQIFYQN